MFTVNLIVADDVLVTTGMTQGQLDQVITGIEQAAALWSRYLDGNNAVIDLALGFDYLKDSQGNDGVLARAGSSFYTQNGGPVQSEVINELNGQSGVFSQDGTFTLDLPDLLSDRFYFSDSLDFIQNPGATGQIDFLTLATHELGHVLGFLGISFEGFVVNNQFTGANAVAANGGNPVQLADGVHTAGNDLLSPSISSNLREPLTAVHIAILQDLGIPIHQATAAADTLYGFNLNNDRLNGLDGDDSLFGLSGSDILNGGRGDDILYGGTGNDYLRGQAGSDFLDGGDGNDWAFYNTSKEAIFVNLNIGSASGGDAEGDTLSSIERVFGSNQNDSITGDGNSNYLRGGGGNDYLRGLEGLDYYRGEAGNDRIAFVDGAGIDVLLDFEDNIDTLLIQESIWDGNLDITQVLDTYAAQVGNHVYLNFGDGDSFRIFNTEIDDLVDDILLI